jgi:hypothetical protein
MSDQWETFCDASYYHMWRLRRETERGWNDGFHINTKAEAEGLCELLNKLEGELTEAREQREEARVIASKYEDRYFEAKEQCSNLDDQVSSAMMVIRGLERERDRLAGALREIDMARLDDFMGPHDMALKCVLIAKESLAAMEGGPQ